MFKLLIDKFVFLGGLVPSISVLSADGAGSFPAVGTHLWY